jgi:soluble lytic murein transglycosylase
MRWGLPNWSILALSKATDKNALELRFPIVHSSSIIQEAKRNQLDPAMVFAVTRQESAFVAHARSSSGALGLMQLMPATAQLVAKKSLTKYKGHSALLEPATNIRLGTHYLKMMLDSHENHPILATAAYNAGPGRVRKWLPEKESPADAWVENIPFKETREYVKNVMTYTIIYQQLLGQKLKQPKRLPTIPARS